jgi:hypothetical protein
MTESGEELERRTDRCGKSGCDGPTGAIGENRYRCLECGWEFSVAPNGQTVRSLRVWWGRSIGLTLGVAFGVTILLAGLAAGNMQLVVSGVFAALLFAYESESEIREVVSRVV